MVAFPDPTALINSLKDTGQDIELLKIKDTLAAKASEVANLDVSSLTPAQLEVTMSGAQEAVQGSMNSLFAKANQLKPDLISMQEEIANSLGGVATQLGDQLNDAIASTGNSLSGLTDKFQASFELPNLNGLDAGIQSLANDLTSAAKDVGNLLADPISGALSQAKKLNFPVELSADIGLPTGADFGKLIPNIQFKKEAIFDDDGIQIGEKIVALKLGTPATAPVADDTDDSEPDEIVLQSMAPIKSNPIFGDNGLLMSAGRSVINTFKEAIPTAVSFDESTGENIVWEKVEGPDGEEITASGYASFAEFEAAYKEGRKAAAGKIKEAVGGLNQSVGQFSKLAQDAAKTLGNVKEGEFKVPLPPPGFNPTIARKIGIDTITGAPVNIEQVPALRDIEVDADGVPTEEVRDDQGIVVPPGSKAKDFIQQTREKVQQDFGQFTKALNSLSKGKPPSLPSSVRPPSSFNKL